MVLQNHGFTKSCLKAIFQQKHCENEENIGAQYFITSSHFPTRVRYARFGPRSSTCNLARAFVA